MSDALAGNSSLCSISWSKISGAIIEFHKTARVSGQNRASMEQSKNNSSTGNQKFTKTLKVKIRQGF